MIRWKRSFNDYVESYCGKWWITPIYGGCTRPALGCAARHIALSPSGWKIVGSGQTQRECKDIAQDQAAKL
jgi:hypothetical protein